MRVVPHLLLTACLLVCSGHGLLGQQAKPTASSNVRTQYVDVSGHRLRVQTAGSATPTVVFEVGIGDTLDVWNSVVPEVARFARTVTYDRAGLGKSEHGPEPRSFTQIATELHALLHRANIAAPYVLVGHSFGGANIRAFAHLFEDEVAGMVFVDPLTEDIFTHLSEIEKADTIARQDALIVNASAGTQAEWKFLKDESLNNFPQLRSFGKPPDGPIMLLVAGRDRPPHWVQSLLEEYDTWAANDSETGLLVTPDSGHYIQRSDPGLVISAIRRVVFPSVRKALDRVIDQKGVEAAISQYRQMKLRYPAELFGESILYELGYGQLQRQHVREAVALFTLNVEMYPNVFFAYDSLAQAYMVQGDREAATRYFRKSLTLNRENTNAVQMLNKLGAAP
jgi:pimeloyl-ACP methyl ester carboxylesterase